MHLVLIETSGNQDYIFATNKLRENVGASEIIWRIGQFAEHVSRAAPEQIGASEQILHLGETLSRALTTVHGDAAQVVLAASGKAIILVQDEVTGRDIVRAVTWCALKDAPGVDVRGVVSPAFDFESDDMHAVVASIHKRHLELQASVPGPRERFARLPIIAECATSGLPAARFEPPPSPKEKGEPRSAVSRAKRQFSQPGLDRMRAAARLIPLARSVDALDQLQEVEWLAVVHADGNGLGQMFLDFGQLVHDLRGARTNQLYASALGEFSRALDVCTQNAFRAALEKIWPPWLHRAERRRKKPPEFLPLLPLVLGGDDLTIVCDGRLAVPFTVEFLQEFERQTRLGLVGDLCERRVGMPVRGLAACAGVAIVKPHFPFYAAYGLAEQLLKSAKQVKQKVNDRPCSAFDFQILYDASGPDLARIRGEWTLEQGATHLTARPCVVSTFENAPDWVAMRHVTRLQDCLNRIRATQDGRTTLPNSMLHELREGLFLGRLAAEARLKLALGRHMTGDFGPLLHNQQLFWPENSPGEGQTQIRHHTVLLDAMDLSDFWEQENSHA